MATGKKQPIRTAVAGLGRAGWNMHVAAVRGRKDFVLTDVIDLEEKRREEARAEFGCRTFRSWSKFLRESDAELVVVATQSKDHARQSLQALKAGLHVLVEKPMATRVRDADRMIAQAKESGRVLTVHQSVRHTPEAEHIRDVMRSGVLGRVFMIKRGGYGFGRRRDWQVLRKYGGGQLNNNGVHIIDQVVHLLDSPVKDVFGDLQQILNPGDAEDHVKVVIRAESGMVADVEVTTACALPLPAWVLMGSRGTLVSDGKTSHLRYYKAKKLPPLRPEDSTMVASRSYGIGEVIEFVEKSVPASLPVKRNFYDHLYDSIRKGKPLYVTPESSREVLYVLQQARRGTPFA